MIEAVVDWGLNHMDALGRICLGSILSFAFTAAVKVISIKKRSDVLEHVSEQ